jgi:hypothetical protein
MLYVRLEILDECCFSLVLRKPGEFGLFPKFLGFPEIPGLARTLQTFEHQISFAFFLVHELSYAFHKLHVAHHKHPTIVILSCLLSLCKVWS